MNSETLADMIVSHRHFRNLYDTTGVIGFGRDYIQLTIESFADFKTLGEVVVVRRGTDAENPYEVSVTYRGVKFLTIGTVLEFDAIGINVL